MRSIYLASASPRRSDILTQAGFDYTKIIANVNELIYEERPEKIVENLAERKASFVAEMVSQYYNYLVIGADTVVFIDGEVLGKPDDIDQARYAISTLSGRTHQVITGVSLYYDISESSGVRLHKNIKFHETTLVEVAELSEREIEDYLETNEWMDKAGGYAIQGAFCKYITKITGEYENVVGFPIARFYSEYKRLGL